MALTWAEQYRHPKWQMRRLEKMKAADATCERCGETEITLNVHHKRYVKGRMVWEYSDAELECLCESCHAEHHSIETLLNRVLATTSGVDLRKEALGLIAGYLAAAYELDHELEAEVRSVSGTVDIGIAAFTVATSDAHEVARAFSAWIPEDARGPVLRDLIERWSPRKKDG